jgi:hypothetical protein
MMNRIIKCVHIFLMVVIMTVLLQHVYYQYERQVIFKQTAERMAKSVEDYNP